MNFNDILASEKPILVDFFATWCGPCKAMSPILQEVKESLGDDVTIIKIDVDKNPQAANAYKVRSVPTLIMFKKGKIVWQQSGMASKTALVEQFTKHK